MLGLGIGEKLPHIIYGAAFITALFALIYRSEAGILFIASLLPVYRLLDKALKLDLPFANNITDIVVVAMLLGWLFQHKTSREESFGPSPLVKPIALFMMYSLTSYLIGTLYLDMDLLSEDAIQRLADWKNYMIMPLLYVVSYYNLRTNKFKYALFFILALSFLVSDLKFHQTFQWFKHTNYDPENRISGTLGALGPNEWGSFHAIYTLLFVGLFIVDKHVWRRLVYGSLIVGGAYSLIYSYSRGAYAGILAGLFFIGIARKRSLLPVLLLFLVTWKSIVPTSVVQRVESTFLDEVSGSEVVTIGETYVFTAGRKHLWEKSFDNFMQNPITGTGYKTFSYMYNLDTHNIFLKILAEQGLIGIIIFLWFYLMAFRSGWRLSKEGRDGFSRALGFGFACAVVGSIVVNLFGDRWTYLQIGGIYWILWALVDQENIKLSSVSETAAVLESQSRDGLPDNLDKVSLSEG